MKFEKLHKDQELQNIQRQIQDNLADKSDLNEKKSKNKSFVTVEPKLTDMADGDELAYDDGTNFWIYRRIGSKLFKSQQTEV